MNKKGFTLTELLVVVVLLGLVSGLSIPLIRNLTGVFEKKKYQSYADGVLASARLYNDAYTEDLFGHNEYGCAYITYDKMVEKNLLKDIEVDGISCNSDKTYVRVTKQKDKYGYKTFLTCGKRVRNGKVVDVTKTIPSVIPDMNTDACTGVDESNLVITADETQTNNDADKNRKRTSLTITSGTGINKNPVLYAKWSKNEEDYANAGFEKVDFKITGNQEAKILNGEWIESKSSELISPKDTGTYYLIVRVDRLEDLYGHQWRNTKNPGSKYITFGPFVLDSTPPTIKVDAYKCDSSSKKTGSVMATKTHSGSSTVFDLSNMTGMVNGWATSANYPYGVCLDIEITDTGKVKTTTWQWNPTGKKATATDYIDFADNRKETIDQNKASVKIEKSLTGDGHRYVRITAKDLAGNKSTLDIDVKCDASGPDTLNVTNDYENTWTRADVPLKITTKDKNEINGIGKYYYTYNSSANAQTAHTENGNYSHDQWVVLRGTIASGVFTSEVWKANDNAYIDTTVYISTSDAVSNYSSVTKSTRIKIDKVPPKVDKLTNPHENEWTNSSISLKIKASDAHSGVDSYYYSYKSNATDYTGKTDSDANSKWVKLNGNPVNGELTTEAIWATTMEKVVYIKVKDKVGNYSGAYATVIKIDKTPPKKPTITNPNANEWTTGLTMTIASQDNESGIANYQYTYKSDPPSSPTSTTNANDYWRIEPGATTSANSYDSAFSAEGDRDVWWRVCDAAGNCSEKTKTHVKIDATSPSCGSDVWYDPDTQGETYGVSGSVGCSDDESGCEDGTGYFSRRKSNGYVTIYDNAGNTNECWIEISGYDCNCYKYNCSYYVRGTDDAANCSNACDGIYLWEQDQYVFFKSMGGNGGYYVCTDDPNYSGGAYTGMGCCRCGHSCDEDCDTCYW